MGKYLLFPLVLVYGCFVHKKAEPVPSEAYTWRINYLEADLFSYKYGHGQEWVESYPSEPYHYPGSDSVLIDFLYFPHQDKFKYSWNRYVYSWNIYDYGERSDSVFLGPVKFRIKEEFILSTVLTAPDYRLQLVRPPDSRNYDWNYIHVLFGNFYGTPVREDFFYANGTLRQSMFKDGHGDDSVCHSWYPDGRLQARKDRNRMDYYFPDGSHLSISDTSVKGVYNLTSATYYQPNGHLQRQEFYAKRTPVHNWTYYNENGKLIKTVKKKSLDSVTKEVHIEAVEEGPIIDRTLDYLDVQKGIIRDKLIKSLVTRLDSSSGDVKSGSYRFLVKCHYSEDMVTVIGVQYPSENPEYQKWMNEQIQATVVNVTINNDLYPNRIKLESTFIVRLEISPKQTKSQN